MAIFTYTANKDPHDQTRILRLRDGALIVEMGHAADFYPEEVAQLSSRVVLTPGASGPISEPGPTEFIRLQDLLDVPRPLADNDVLAFDFANSDFKAIQVATAAQLATKQDAATAATDAELTAHANTFGRGGHIPTTGLTTAELAFDVATQVELDAVVAASVIIAPATSARNVIQATADVVPFTIKAAAATQTANLFEAQTSAGVVVFGINSTGSLGVGTPTPTYHLHVKMSSGSAVMGGVENTLAGGRAEFYIVDPSNKWTLMTGGTSHFTIRDNLNSAEKFGINRGGNGAITLNSGTGGVNLNGPLLATSNSASAFGGAAIAGAILGVTTNQAGNTGQVVRGVASQTADLQQWQNSAGTILTKVSSQGRLGIGIGAGGLGAMLHLQADAAATVGAIVKGFTAQTGDLIQAQDSAAAVLASISSGGSISTVGDHVSHSGTGAAITLTSPGARAAMFFNVSPNRSQIVNPATGVVSVRAFDAIANTFTVAASTSQGTANIQEWQNSSFTTRAYVDPNGYGNFLRFQIGSGAPITATALLVTANSATDVPITAKGFTAATADLFQVQDSTGAALVAVSAGGQYSVTLGASTNTAFSTKTAGDTQARFAQNAAGQMWWGPGGATGQDLTLSRTAPGALTLQGQGGATKTALVVKAVAGQAVGNNTVEVQDSTGAIASRFDSDGTLMLNGAARYVVGLNAPSAQIIGSGSGIAGATFAVRPGATTTTGIAIQGMASQTGDLLQAQDSTGAALSRVTSGGFLAGSGLQHTSLTGPYLAAATSMMVAVSRGATQIPWIARGAASQTADLQQWQDSTSAVLSQMSSDGRLGLGALGSSRLYVKDAGIAGTNVMEVHADDESPWLASFFNDTFSTSVPVFKYFGYNNGQFRMGSDSATAPIGIFTNGYTNVRLGIDSAGLVGIGVGMTTPSGQLHVKTATLTQVPLVLQLAAAATADLEQRQNSAGTVLSRFDSTGGLHIPALQVGTATTAGWVLTADTSGNATWAPAPGAGGSAITLQDEGVALGTQRGTWNFIGAGVTAADDAANARTNITIPGADLSTAVILAPAASTRNIIQPTAATVVPLVSRGFASQTANLFEAQDSTGAVRQSIGPAGQSITVLSALARGVSVTAPAGSDFSDTGNQSFYAQNNTGTSDALLTARTADTVVGTTKAQPLYLMTNSSARMTIASNGQVTAGGSQAVGVVPFVTKGVASQTADLLQVQNSAGSALSRFDSTGGLHAPALQVGTSTTAGNLLTADASGNATWTAPDRTPVVILAPTSSTRNIIQPTGAAFVPLAVRAFASQTANLQEWQNSAGTVLSRVAADGSNYIPATLSHTGTLLGFYNVTPAARAAARTMSNWTVGANALRTIDRNTYTPDQLFDFVMTMASDLQAVGLFA